MSISIKMIRLLPLIMIFMCNLLLCEIHAACTGSSPTWNCAADSTATQINSCISSASVGDTINIAAGSGTWSSTVEITKGIYLIGAGIGSTVITSSANPVIAYRPSSSSNDAMRISSFSFNGSGSRIELFNMDHYPKHSKVRVDHNRFYGGSGPAIQNNGCYGVIDNNIIEVTSGPPCRNWGSTTGVAGGQTGEWEWETSDTYGEDEMPYGSANNMYYEDNVFSGVTSETQIISDGDAGTRYVYRYNTVTSTYSYTSFLDMHGAHSSIYGAMGVEVYGNYLNGVNDFTRILAQRASRTIMFYNSCIGASSSTPGSSRTANVAAGGGDHCPQGSEPIYSRQFWNNSYYFNNRRDGNSTVLKYSIGSSGCEEFTITENVHVWQDASPFTGATGVGCGTLAARPATCTVGVGYWATDQSCSDLTGMVGANPTTPISGTLYRCTAPNTWTAYYTPYTYPHPLRGDLTPPEYLLGEILANGTTFIATFSENMVVDTGNLENDEFNLDCINEGADQTLTYVSGTGKNQITFTIGSEIENDDTCNCDCVNVDADEYEDAAGNDLETFDDGTVTNNAGISGTDITTQFTDIGGTGSSSYTGSTGSTSFSN
jgi:hypothetical protein